MNGNRVYVKNASQAECDSASVVCEPSRVLNKKKHNTKMKNKNYTDLIY